MDKEKILEFLEIEVKHNLPKGHWGSVKNYINSLPQEDEVYPKCSRCSLYLEMGDDWREQSKKLVDDYIKQTANYQNQIAKRMIEEFLHDSYSDYPEHAGDVYIIRDKLYRWLEGRE